MSAKRASSSLREKESVWKDSRVFKQARESKKCRGKGGFCFSPPPSHSLCLLRFFSSQEASPGSAHAPSLPSPPCTCALSRLSAPPPLSEPPLSVQKKQRDRQRKTNFDDHQNAAVVSSSSSLPTQRDGPPLRRREAQGAQEAGQGAQEVRRVDFERQKREENKGVGVVIDDGSSSIASVEKKKLTLDLTPSKKTSTERPPSPASSRRPTRQTGAPLPPPPP